MRAKFSQQISKNTRISDFIKFRRWGAEVFHVGGRTDTWTRTDRQTEMTKLIVALGNSVNTPKESILLRPPSV